MRLREHGGEIPLAQFVGPEGAEEGVEYHVISPYKRSRYEAMGLRYVRECRDARGNTLLLMVKGNRSKLEAPEAPPKTEKPQGAISKALGRKKKKSTSKKGEG